MDEYNPTPFFAPEGAVMLFMALMFDAVDFGVNLFPAIGQLASLPLDILALLFFGSWMLLRSGVLKVPTKTAARVGKAAKWARSVRWLRPLLFFLEFVPAVSALPLWVLVVYFEIKYG